MKARNGSLPLTIRKPTSRQDVLAFEPILQYSLFFPPLTEMDWIAIEGHENFRLAWRGRTLAGGLSLHHMGQWFGGRSVKTAAVRCVAVEPALRSQGIARALLGAHFEELRAEGTPLSTLYPSTQSFYRLSGYERAGTRTQWRVPTASLGSKMPRGVEVRPMAPADTKAIRVLYAERMRHANGPFDRSEWMWSRVLAPPGAKNSRVHVSVEEGRVTGWVACRVESVPGALAAGLLRVTDLWAGTRRGLEAILAFLGGHRSVVKETVMWSGPSEPLWQLIPNQDAQPDNVLHWMLRLVDVKAALEARGWPRLSGADLELNVTDDVCPWNQGRFVLGVEAGHASIRKGGRGKLKVSARALASIYSGHLSPFAARAAGMLTGGDDDVGAMAELFAGPAPWMPDGF